MSDAPEQLQSETVQHRLLLSVVDPEADNLLWNLTDRRARNHPLLQKPLTVKSVHTITQTEPIDEQDQRAVTNYRFQLTFLERYRFPVTSLEKIRGESGRLTIRMTVQFDPQSAARVLREPFLTQEQRWALNDRSKQGGDEGKAARTTFERFSENLVEFEYRVPKPITEPTYEEFEFDRRLEALGEAGIHLSELTLHTEGKREYDRGFTRPKTNRYQLLTPSELAQKEAEEARKRLHLVETPEGGAPVIDINDYRDVDPAPDSA